MGIPVCTMQRIWSSFLVEAGVSRDSKDLAAKKNPPSKGPHRPADAWLVGDPSQKAFDPPEKVFFAIGQSGTNPPGILSSLNFSCRDALSPSALAWGEPRISSCPS